MLRFICLVAACWSLHFDLFAMDSQAVRRSVFKVNVISQSPSFSQPWMQGYQNASSGTGFFIGDGRILTNAHVVAQSRYVTIQRDGDDHPVPAKVKFIANDCDLALLEAETKEAIENATPLKIGGLPELRKPVATIGYPRGGEQISITEGVVSRISYRTYTHSGHHQHLLVQVDSAINSGNSGGPVIQGDTVVGVAFQAYTNAENTGYIIPTPVIRRFLKDIEDGWYDGHPDIGLKVLEDGLNNPALRRYHKLGDQEGGIKVTYVAPYAPTAGKIKKDDILLAIDAQPIGYDGKIRFQGERVSFKALFDLKQMGDKVTFRLSREGQLKDVQVTIRPSYRHHYPAKLYPQFSRYDIYAGVVFSSLSLNYLKEWGKMWYQKAPIQLRYLHWFSTFHERFKSAQEIVVISGRLPDAVNVDAAGYEENVIDKINGQIIMKLEDIAKAIPLGSKEFIVIELWHDPVPILLPRMEAEKVHPLILKRYGVEPARWLEPVATFIDQES